jgi:hypothetical protein
LKIEFRQSYNNESNFIILDILITYKVCIHCINITLFCIWN